MNENVIMFNGVHLAICFGLLLVGIGFGFALGWVYAEERREKKFEKIMDEIEKPH